jgi:DNA ligase-1
MLAINKPMLADNSGWHPELVKANLPLLGSIKLDGIRMLVDNGIGYSRSLKPLRNKQLQAKVAAEADTLQGFDGEVVVGNFTDEFCFKNSSRACVKTDLEAEHKFYVFDRWDMKCEYTRRLSAVKKDLEMFPSDFAQFHGSALLHTYDEVMEFVEELLQEGHEGAIFRRSDAPYKNGRATAKSGGMYKYKSRVDTEIVVTGFFEMLVNNNPKTTNELGRSSRSIHKENMIPANTLGYIEGTGFFEDGTPFKTKVGVFKGFTKADLQNIWDKKEKFLGKLMKIKYMGVGSDLAPRTPVALGFRDEIDTSD